MLTSTINKFSVRILEIYPLFHTKTEKFQNSLVKIQKSKIYSSIRDIIYKAKIYSAKINMSSFEKHLLKSLPKFYT